MSSSLRIVHCDDSPDTLMLLEHWLEDHPDLVLVSSARGVRASIEQVREHQPDVVVTDTLGMTGDATFLRWLRDAAPDAAVVLFTGYRASQLVPDIVELADRVVTKGIDEAELVAELRSLRRGTGAS